MSNSTSRLRLLSGSNAPGQVPAARPGAKADSALTGEVFERHQAVYVKLQAGNGLDM
jgi:hypothetical protein